MLGLPIKTSLLVFGFPLFWLLYAIAFLLITKNWKYETDSKER